MKQQSDTPYSYKRTTHTAEVGSFSISILVIFSLKEADSTILICWFTLQVFLWAWLLVRGNTTEARAASRAAVWNPIHRRRKPDDKPCLTNIGGGITNLLCTGPRGWRLAITLDGSPNNIGSDEMCVYCHGWIAQRSILALMAMGGVFRSPMHGNVKVVCDGRSHSSTHDWCVVLGHHQGAPCGYLMSFARAVCMDSRCQGIYADGGHP
jgi:hypothetical protein